jgi:hypothetical protein
LSVAAVQARLTCVGETAVEVRLAGALGGVVSGGGGGGAFDVVPEDPPPQLTKRSAPRTQTRYTYVLARSATNGLTLSF